MMDRYLKLSNSYNKVYYRINSRIHNAIFDRIRSLISEKIGITGINHNFSKIRIDSYNSLPIAKMLTFNNVIILSKSVVNKNKNDY